MTASPVGLQRLFVVVALWPGLVVFYLEVNGNVEVQQEDGEQAETRGPQQRRPRLEGGGVGVERIGAGEDEQVAGHVNEDEADQQNAGDGDDVLFADRRAEGAWDQVHRSPFSRT